MSFIGFLERYLWKKSCTWNLSTAVLGNKLPGPGSIYMGQELKFLAPVFIGDTITAEVEIIELIPEKLLEDVLNFVNA